MLLFAALLNDQVIFGKDIRHFGVSALKMTTGVMRKAEGGREKRNMSCISNFIIHP